MNSTLIIKTLLIFFLFSGFGLIASLIADDSIKNKPTEESYLKSLNYKETKQSYQDAMVNYDETSKRIGLFGSMLTIFGLVSATLYYGLTRRDLMRNVK